MLKVEMTMPRKSRVQLVAKRGEDVVILKTAGQGDGTEWKKVARELHCDPSFLLGKVLAVTSAQPQEFEVEEASGAGGPNRFYVRNLTQPRTEALTAETFDQALALPGEIIEWDSIEELCCLDIDYHGREAPRPEWLLQKAATLVPVPNYYWVSRGGGLHLVYTRAGYIPANELAAVASIGWLHFEPHSRTELLRNTRCPPAGNEVRRAIGPPDITEVARLLGRSVDNRLVAEWLDSRGLRVGGTYTHDHCPVWPGESANGQPVAVFDGLVYCARCHAAGKCYGSRKPGAFPYTALVGGGPSSLIRVMADRFCHWEQAKVVLEDRIGLTGPNAKLAWQALLHVVHGDDPRVARAMTAGENCIRLDSRWSVANGSRDYTKDITNIIAAMPACQNADGQPIGEMVTRFLQPIDLSNYGYHTITPIHGVRIFSQFRELPDGQISVVMPHPLLRPEEYVARRPAYVPVKNRMPLDEAFGVLSEVYPGLNRNYLMLLIAAKGISEGKYGSPPYVLTGGVSKAGKTRTAHIAAAICGDSCTDIVWQHSVERFRQAYQAGAHAGSFVCVNELFKDSERQGVSGQQAMDIFLNITPASVTHVMYIGPMPMGRLPATIVTDVNIPPTIRSDFQVARRFVYVRLPDMVEWENTSVRAGVAETERLRLADERYAIAGNAILSEVTDRWFIEPKIFSDIASDLGYTTLDKAEDFEDSSKNLKRFYELVHLTTESTERRWEGGWKTIRRGEETELAEIWDMLCDGTSAAQWGTSRRVAEQDWSKVMGSEHPLRCEIRRHGNTVGIRFVKG